MSKEQFIYRALLNLTADSGSIKFVICSACPINIWREPGETLGKTKSIVQKRKISMNGDLSPGKEKDQTWSMCPLPYKKAKVSEKLHRRSQWHSLSFIKAIESRSQSSQKTTRETKKTSLVIIHGKTGCGKSRFAARVSKELYPNSTYYKPRGEWWDGYEQDKLVIMDDFFGWIKYDELLKITDHYP